LPFPESIYNQSDTKEKLPLHNIQLVSRAMFWGKPKPF